MNIYFDKCIVIGTGQFAFMCAKYIQNIYQVDCVYEYGGYHQSQLEALCKRNNIAFTRLLSKSECDTQMEILVRDRKKVLIISASNIYIFPAFVTECSYIRIVNYHPALLTKHLGRNSEAWAIYCQDKISGVTWHEVSPEIDRGAVLAEKEIELDETITAVRLMKKQYQMGLELFRNFIADLMENNCIFRKTVQRYGKMHYSYEKPNGGILDLSWNEDKISAFLRSMDYGSLNVMGSPVLIEEDSKYVWDSYKILESDFSGGYAASDKIIIRKKHLFILYHYHVINM